VCEMICISVLIAANDGAAGTWTSTQIISHTIPGPLREELTRLAGHLDTLNVGGVNWPKVQIAFISGTSPALTTPVGYNIHWEADAFSAAGTAGAEMQIEIRYINSAER